MYSASSLIARIMTTQAMGGGRGLRQCHGRKEKLQRGEAADDMSSICGSLGPHRDGDEGKAQVPGQSHTRGSCSCLPGIQPLCNQYQCPAGT